MTGGDDKKPLPDDDDLSPDVKKHHRFPTKRIGTIKTLRDSGFGFIEPDGDSGSGELFFHGSAVADSGFERLQEGQRVTFDVTPDPRDPSRQRAINVIPADAE